MRSNIDSMQPKKKESMGSGIWDERVWLRILLLHPADILLQATHGRGAGAGSGVHFLKGFCSKFPSACPNSGTSVCRRFSLLSCRHPPCGLQFSSRRAEQSVVHFLSCNSLGDLEMAPGPLHFC